MLTDPILIVDDEPDLRSTLQDSLTTEGYTVEVCDSADAALRMIALKHYPVIVTDLQMPGSNSGLDLIAAVKGRDSRSLCVVITGYASLGVAIEALKSGAYDFLQKPFKLVELQMVLDRALDHARLLRQLDAYQSDLEARVLARVKDLKDFHEEAMVLNSLLLKAQGAMDERQLFTPFLCHLEERFDPDGYALMLPSPEGWQLLLRGGRHLCSECKSLPSHADDFQEVQKWLWDENLLDGYLVPLKKGDTVLALLFIGFKERTAFQPGDACFVLWRTQVEAALHGLRCARAHAAEEVRKALERA